MDGGFKKKGIRNCQLKYKCTKTWDELTSEVSKKTILPVVDSKRHCDLCNEFVYRVPANPDSSEEVANAELTRHIRANHCVYIPPPVIRIRPYEIELMGLPAGPTEPAGGLAIWREE